MKVAIVGAGFSGWAVCWHLLQQTRAEITVFEKQGINKRPSGMAAGLLHPYAGAHAKRNWMGLEGLKATQKLLQTASTQLQKEIVLTKGILRLALDVEQCSDYQEAAKQHSDVTWLNADTCQKMVPGIAPCPGLYISQGMQVNCSLYLQGLEAACIRQGVHFENSEIKNLEELQDFDVVIVAAGMQTKSFSELAYLPLRAIKGQILEIEWPRDIPPLPLPLNSQAYVLMQPDGLSCVAGATFERNFVSSEPDLSIACAEILPKLHALYPPLRTAKIIGCQAGVRASTPDHRPIYGKVNDKIWYLAGLGSKGLLYHALFAEKLAQELVNSKGTRN